MDVSSRNATGQVRETIRASGLINFWPSVRRMFPLPIIKHPEQRTTVASEHSSDPFLVFVFMKRSEQCSILNAQFLSEKIARHSAASSDKNWEFGIECRWTSRLN